MAETNPIKTLRRAVEANDERGEVMPCSLADLTAARVALGQVEAAVAALGEVLDNILVREELNGRCFTCGAGEHHAHSPTCSMKEARAALAPFQVRL